MDKVVWLWYGGVEQEAIMVQRKRHGGAFKTRVVVEAIAGHKTINEVAGAFEVEYLRKRLGLWRSNGVEG